MGHGRRVDHDIMAFFKKMKRKKDLTRDAQGVLQLFTRKRWKIVACQHRVSDHRRHTFIDIVCRARSGTLVIVEMKTTLQPFAKYRRFYLQPDPKAPTMTDGTPNSKYWRHQKQLAGNMQLWRAQEGNRHKVIGVVLVVCRGVTSLIPLARALANQVVSSISR
jgi:hypothetical protein